MTGVSSPWLSVTEAPTISDNDTCHFDRISMQRPRGHMCTLPQRVHRGLASSRAAHDMKRQARSGLVALCSSIVIPSVCDHGWSRRTGARSRQLCYVAGEPVQKGLTCLSRSTLVGDFLTVDMSSWDESAACPRNLTWLIHVSMQTAPSALAVVRMRWSICSHPLS